MRTRRQRSLRRWRLDLGLAATIALVGTNVACSGEQAPTPETEESTAVPQVEVPSANGPKLVALKSTVVRDRPSFKGQVLGYLRAGAQIARAKKPFSKKGCEGGWYPVRPRGFVCGGEEISLDVKSPLAQILEPAPDLDKALPYRYGRVSKGAAVVYGKLPTAAEQQVAESTLPELKARSKRLGPGANDVPVDEQMAPTGPPVVRADGDGVGADGYRTTDSYFVFPGAQTPPPPLVEGMSLVPTGGDKTQVLKRRSGVALMRSFLSNPIAGARRFGVLTDGRFIPTDRLKPALGTVWHGVDLSKVGLPVAFTLRPGICPYLLEKKKAKRLRDEEFTTREPIMLTGRFRTLNSQRYYFTRDNHWVRHKDIILIPKRHKFPDFASEHQKWVDISLANQTLTAFVGHKPLYATLISSGRDRLGDPHSGPSTLQGVFRIRSKHISRAIDDRENGQTFSIAEAPWVIEFAEGFAITGAYWLRRFGEAQSYHNIALAPVDAHWLWHWSDPHPPEGWHGAMVSKDEPSTIIYIHK